MKYLALGVLFVNVSIGGTLTAYAAPPVLMVAAAWQWDSAFMAATFGWKAAIAVVINATVATFVLRRHLRTPPAAGGRAKTRVPLSVVAVHIGLLAAVVLMAHHPVAFLAIFLLFLGFTQAYEQPPEPADHQGGAAGRLLPRGAGGAGRHAGLVAAADRLQPATAGAVLRLAGPDRHHRQRRADLPGLADRRHLRRVQIHAGGRRGGRRRPDGDRQRAEPGRRGPAQAGFTDETVGAGGLLLGALGPTAVARS